MPPTHCATLVECQNTAYWQIRMKHDTIVLQTPHDLTGCLQEVFLKVKPESHTLTVPSKQRNTDWKNDV